MERQYQNQQRAQVSQGTDVLLQGLRTGPATDIRKALIAVENGVILLNLVRGVLRRRMAENLDFLEQSGRMADETCVTLSHALNCLRQGEEAQITFTDDTITIPTGD